MEKASGRRPPPAPSASVAALTPAQAAALAAIMKQWNVGRWEKLADDTWRYTAPAAQDGGRSTLMTLGLGDDSDLFDAVNEQALAWAQRRAAEMVGMRRLADGRLVTNPDAHWAITDSTRRMLRELVADRIGAGTGVNQLRQAVADSAAFAPSRALNIAATELQLAAHSGGLLAAKDSGLALTKEVLLSDLHPEPDECDDYAALGSLPLDDEYAPGVASPPFHPACACDMSYSRAVAQAAGAAQKVFDESQVVRDSHGRFADQGGPKLRPTHERAFTGQPRELASRPDKRETGRTGEEIARAYLRDEMGLADVAPLNTEQPNAPVDLMGGDAVVEVKTGLVSNGPGAQKWRATIGQPGKAESEWLGSASATEKAAWNRDKAQAIMALKDTLLREMSARAGAALRAYTVGIILDPDRRIADVHVFDGFHASIRWRGEAARAAYKGSYGY